MANKTKPYKEAEEESMDDLLQQVQGFEKELDKGFDFDDYRDKVDKFIAGGHYPHHEKDEMDAIHEGTDMEGEWPVIPYTFEVLEKQVCSLTRYQTRPKVIAEDAADYAMLPEGHPFKMLRMENPNVFKKKTDNEIFAMLMSGRLETAHERARMDEIYDDAAEYAARYRHVDILVRWEGENEREGIVCEALPDGAEIDPRAPGGDLTKGRFVRYKIRRTVKWVRENLNYEPRGTDTASESYRTQKGDVGDTGDYSFSDERVQPDDRLLDVWVWFLRDDTMVEEEATEYEEELMLDAMGMQVINPHTMQPVMRQVEKKVKYKTLKYPGGWKMFYKMQDEVLQLQKNPNPSGRPPIHRFEWVRNPRKSGAIGVYDLTKDANQAADHSLKYAIENSNRDHTRILYDKAAIPDIHQAVQQSVADMIGVDANDKPLSEVYTVIRPNPLAGAHLQLAPAVMSINDKAVGAVDIREPGGGANRVTGDAVEGMNGPDADRADRRLRRWLRVKRDIAYDMMWLILEYEDMERTVKLGRDMGEPTYVSFDRTLFDFEEWEFEARWDIVMREPDDLPANRSKRNRTKLDNMELVLGLPPRRAKMALRILDLEDTEVLRVMLEEEIEAMEAEAPEPTEIDIMQAKADIEIAKETAIIELKSRMKVADSISEALETMSQKLTDLGQLQAALYVLSMIPNAAAEAMKGTSIEQNEAFQNASGAVNEPMGGGMPMQQPPTVM